MGSSLFATSILSCLKEESSDQKERTFHSSAQHQMFMRNISNTSRPSAHQKLLLLSVWIQTLKLISELDNASNSSESSKKSNQETEPVEEVAETPSKRRSRNSCTESPMKHLLTPIS